MFQIQSCSPWLLFQRKQEHFVNIQRDHLLFSTLWQFLKRNENVVKEIRSQVNTGRGRAPYSAKHDFALEWTKHYHSKLDYRGQLNVLGMSLTNIHTIHVD